MSDYRRGYSWELVHYIEAPVHGWNPDAMPWELGPGEAAVLDNFLIRSGKVSIRGSFIRGADLSASAPLGVCGGVVAGQTLLAFKNGAGVDPWNTPLLRPASTALASAKSTLTWAPNTGVVTNLAGVSADLRPGPRWINFDGLLYGIAYDSTLATVSDVNSTYTAKQTALLTMAKNLPPTSVSRPAGTGANDAAVGTVAWTNPANVATGNPATPASAPLSASTTSQYLKTSAHGFAIPSTATILGIQLVINCSGGVGTQATDAHIKLAKAGAVVGSDRAAPATNWMVPGVFGNRTYGGSADLWGTTWLPADINSAGFGAAISAIGSATTASVDSAVITVYYALPTSTPTPAALALAPHGAFDLAGHLSRIWLIGGVDTPGSGTTHSPTTIFYTNPIASGGGSASADWKDPVSGLTNKIQMDRNASDYGVALAAVRNGLLVLRRSSVWIVRGTTSANFTASLVSSEVGCLDARSVVETDAGVYFMSPRGLMLTDGVRVVNVSGPCTYTLQRAVAAQQLGVIQYGGGYITSCLTSEGSILISMGGYTPANNCIPIWSALYDPTSKTWARLTSKLWSDDGVTFSTGVTSSQVAPNLYPGIVMGTASPRQLVAVGDKYVTVLEDQNIGISFLARSNLYDLLAAGSSVITYLAIPARWDTKYPPIVGTSTRKIGAAKRFFFDYAMSNFTSGSLTVTPADPSGTPYASVLVAAPGSPAVQGSISNIPDHAVPAVQRQNEDFVNEVSDVGFSVVWDSPDELVGDTNTVADVFGVGIEYQPGRDLR